MEYPFGVSDDLEHTVREAHAGRRFVSPLGLIAEMLDGKAVEWMNTSPTNSRVDDGHVAGD